jgi:ribose transport system permease protein
MQSNSTSDTAVAKPNLSPIAKVRALFQRSTVLFPLVSLIAVSIIMAFASSDFLTLSNFASVLRQISINAIIAVGMTMVILTGGIDLSVGALMAFAGAVAAGLMVFSGVPAAVALLACLGVGIVFGVANGLIVSYAGMPSIIVTLASMSVARGLTYSGGRPISGMPDWVGIFGRGEIAGVSTPIIIMLVVYALAWLLLERTPFGRYVYAIGGNEQATRLSGVRVGPVKVAVYAIAGLTTAIAAIVFISRVSSGQASAGTGFELDAIAAVVLGGTAISGGRGSIVGTLIGALVLGILNNGLNMMSFDPYSQLVIKGLIILVATYIGRERRT